MVGKGLQVLHDGSEVELVACTGKAAQPHTLEAVVCLQVRKAHLVVETRRKGPLVKNRCFLHGQARHCAASWSPWQNPYVERLIGTVRRECLDGMLVFGEAHLRQILSSYAAYYNEVRTHLGLGKDAPLGRAVQRTGVIVAIPILSGLHHHYVRI
jgi:integrase-like protein